MGFLMLVVAIVAIMFSMVVLVDLGRFLYDVRKEE